jgi:hypothetical protein
MISAYIYGRVPLYSQAEAVALSAVVDAIKDGNQLEHGDSAFLLSLVARLKFGPHDELVEDDAPDASSPPEFVGRGLGVMPPLKGNGRGEHRVEPS